MDNELTNKVLVEPKNWKNYFGLKKISLVIRMLTLVDIVVLSGLGLVTPIFAVFITQSIKGGNVEIVGIAVGVFLITKSIFQIPFGLIIDKKKGEKDDFWIMFLGYVLFSLTPLLYLLVKTPNQLYFVEFLHGIASAMALPSWYAIFTRHIDKNYEGIEWATYNTTVSLGSAGTAFLGGFLANKFGFDSLFVLVSIVSFSGTMFLLFTRKQMRKGDTVK
ncbi:MFS transporter [Patescibacteria group bacterium]|nr:MFS transporter [Patescibacteria group bacterium]MBU2633522.1 MFS transporter [Patescibacteria group bacterium]